MHVEPHHTADELAALIRAEPRVKIARRLQAVWLATLGHTSGEAGALVLLSGRQVREWVARYNGGAVEGLEDQAGRGRKGPLDAAQRRALAARLRAGPTAADGVCTLRGADVRRVLEAEFGVTRSPSAVYALLHRLGFEPLRPRPRHPSASAEAQAAFKKVSPRESPRSPRPGRPSGSRSGSRTRRGSAGRAP